MQQLTAMNGEKKILHNMYVVGNNDGTLTSNIPTAQCTYNSNGGVACRHTIPRKFTWNEKNLNEMSNGTKRESTC